MSEKHDVVVIGAGQAGLSISHELTHAGREHVLLERGRVAQTWRTRWDSFTLVLPNWTVSLAGRPYSGDDPDGFMHRAEFVDYMSAYAASFGAPLREGVTVTALERDSDGFTLRTAAGDLSAREVVVASGGYQAPRLPESLTALETTLPVIDSSWYRNPDQIPPGRVLIIGSGQTGCQLAEELIMAGREVWVACGRAPWQPRRVGDHDGIWWVHGGEFMNMTLADLPHPGMRLAPNPQGTGRDGGHDLNYRTLQAMGVTMTGHLAGVEGSIAHFAPDLHESVAFGDARYADFCNLVRKRAAERSIPVPDLQVPEPFTAAAPESVDLREFGGVLVAMGYRPVYNTWIQMDEAFDEAGFPIQHDGSSTVVAGLHFMGVPFQRKRTSASLMGPAEDAAVLAERMARSTTATG